jgi:two-component system LytT family response regulator
VIRALLVDDEPLALRGIRTRLASEPDFEVIGEAEDGPQAIATIRRLRPDVVFLDVQMPGCDGFEVLRSLAADALPLVVFVTAHDAHALRAFEIHALDFLLKPYSEERFQDSLVHLRTAIGRGETEEELARLRSMLEHTGDAAATAPRPRRFAVRERERVTFVRTDDLEAVVAAGNYVQLVAGGRSHLLRLTLTEMERQLDPGKFVRVHRSTIVNVDRIREIHADPHGDGDLVSESGAMYRLSRAYRSGLLPAPGTRR